MKIAEATITSQGQVTVPAEVRRYLGLAKRQRVAFVMEDGAVRLVPLRYTLESAFGAVPPLPGASADLDREIEEAMSDHADRVVAGPPRP